MNVDELFQFSKWFDTHGEVVLSHYDALHSVLSHNASQPDKQPVKEPLEELLNTLIRLPLEQLTSQQESLLEYFQITQFLGKEGAAFVGQTVRAQDYDPASVVSEIAQAKNAIAQAVKRTKPIQTALEALEFVDKLDETEPEKIIVRVQFKGGASISNVVDLKEWSSEWHEIVRGVALCIDEAPEGTRVIGATNGSIIITLLGTYSFAKVLALITKEISSIIKDGLGVLGAIEDLKQKKLLTDTIEQELKGKITDNEEKGVDKILAAIKEQLPEGVDGEKETALKRSVEKYLKFNKQGGELDIIAPNKENADDEDTAFLESEAVEEIRQIVEEVRKTKAEIQLLTHVDEDKDDSSNEDEDGES